MSTPYSIKNQQFTDNMHKLAQERLYPDFFKTERKQLTFYSMDVSKGGLRGELDSKLAIDKLVLVKKNTELKYPLRFTIQERFRKVQYSSFRDITITEWNNKTNQPSELYKFSAQIFVYGICDEYKNEFKQVVFVDVMNLLLKISNSEIPFERELNERSDQYFITINNTELKKHNLILHEFIAKKEYDGFDF